MTSGLVSRDYATKRPFSQARKSFTRRPRGLHEGYPLNPLVFPLCSSCAAFLCTIPVMRIALGADHAGFELKQKIKAHLEQQGIKVEDEGTASTESVDYPDFAKKVGEAVAHKQADLGVLVCGSGIGMAIAANKVS